MFTASAAFAPFDYLRVPYTVTGPHDGTVGRLWSTARGPDSATLSWAQACSGPRSSCHRGVFEVAG